MDEELNDKPEEDVSEEDVSEEDDIEEDSDADEDFDDEEGKEEADKNASVDVPEGDIPAKAETLKPEESKKSVSSISPCDIPVSLTIEVGRVCMTAKRLMALQSGNMLELDIIPENGVDLVINGKKVGKAELIRVGEKLGVRVLEIG